MEVAPSLSLCILVTTFSFSACQNRVDAKENSPRASQNPVSVASTAAITPSAGSVAAASEHELRVDPGDPNSAFVMHAIAELTPLGHEHVKGTVTFTEMGSDTVRVHAEATGLPPGPHAFHVHLFGDCSGSDGKTAGTHLNFRGSSLHPPSNIDRITGNLGEFKADTSGKATAEETIHNVSLNGPYTIIGRSVIVHEKGNDPKSPPIGAAGGRLACGVIGIKEGG